MAGAEYDCDVLIIGLGPVGALLGTLLAQSGVSTIAVEKDHDVYPLPRAAHFDHEVMRIFQAANVAEAILPHTRPAAAYEFRSASGEILLNFGSPRTTASGWAQGYMFHQPAVENALRARLETLAPGAIRLGQTFTALDQDAEGVTVDLSDGSRLRARFVVGCDGGRSPVREALGIKLDDLQFDEPWLVIDVCHGPEASLPKINLQICDPARPTTCVLMGPGRHRWEFMLLPGETAEDVLGDDFILPLLESWNTGPITIERRAVYRFHGLVAKSWRQGRVLLAGDSAHQTPPFAGQGMCAGLRDAVNLSWKLEAILKSGADLDLLDTYQQEREPHVRTYIDLAIGMGRVVCTLDPEAARQRDAHFIAQRAAGVPALPPPAPQPFTAGCILADSPAAGTLIPQPVAAGRRLDDVLPKGAWLIGTGVADPPAGVARIDLNDPDIEPFAAALTQWLASQGAAAVLVRPDRYVFGTGKARDLAEAYGTALGL